MPLPNTHVRRCGDVNETSPMPLVIVGQGSSRRELHGDADLLDAFTGTHPTTGLRETMALARRESEHRAKLALELVEMTQQVRRIERLLRDGSRNPDLVA